MWMSCALCRFVLSAASGDQTAHIWRYMVQLPAPQPPPDVSVSSFEPSRVSTVGHFTFKCSFKSCVHPLSFFCASFTGSVRWRPGLIRPRGRWGGWRGPLWGPHGAGRYSNPQEPPGRRDSSWLVSGRPTSGDSFLGSCCQSVWGGDVWTGSHTHWYVA